MRIDGPFSFLLGLEMSEGRDHLVDELEHRIEILEMKLSARDEIIAAYRDALETFQNEKRLQTALHLHDLEQVTKPKQ